MIEGLIGPIIAAVIGVIGTVIAAFISAKFGARTGAKEGATEGADEAINAVFKPFAERTERNIQLAIGQVEKFSELKDLALLIKASIDAYGGDHTRLKLLRALPCELSDGLVTHIYQGNRLIEDDTKKSLRGYRELIHNIVAEGEGSIEQGAGSYDESIFGRTGVPLIDKATLNAIQHDYLSSVQPPDTSVLAGHQNLDEFGLILIGQRKAADRNEIDEWTDGYFIIFAQDFKRCRGFRYRLHSHIDTLADIFDEKSAEAKARGHSWSMARDMPPGEWERARRYFEEHHFPSLK